ncbi:MAG: hypothetical protein WD036_07465 [Bauldia sp.]
MRISHRYRFIFFANSKTGSESVRAWLNPFSDIRGVSSAKAAPADPFSAHMRPNHAAWAKYGACSLDAYATDDNGTLLVDDVFRLEDIGATPRRLRERGIPIPPDAPIPWKKRPAQATDLAAFYTTPELIELIRERYAKEIARFGYEYRGLR